MSKFSKLSLAIGTFAAVIIIGSAAVSFARPAGQAATGASATKATVEVDDASGKIPLKREEQIAFMFVDAIKHVEAECGRNGGPCTVAQMVAGPKPAAGAMTPSKLKYDPSTDPNYTYKLTINGSNWELWAIPKKAGLGGFYVAPGMMQDTYYNAKGAASNKDRKLAGSSVNGDIFFVG
jgi:hypothetical protein